MNGEQGRRAASFLFLTKHCMMKIMAFAHWCVKKIRIEEWVALCAGSAALITNAVVYGTFASPMEIIERMLRYFTFGDQFYWLMFVMVYGLYLWKFYWFLARIVGDRLIYHTPFPRESARTLIRYFVEPVRAVLPIVIISVSFYGLLGNMSYVLRFSGYDFWFLAFDRAFTGVIPFIALPELFSLPWFYIPVRIAYYSLSGVMGATLGFLFLYPKTQYIFRRALVAFIVSISISYPLFALFPCQDPHNYFIRNVRGGHFTPDVEARLQSYNPPAPVWSSLERMGRVETNEDRDVTVPVSCFPSMHATWAMLIAYFLFRVWRKSLYLTIPWILLLLTGGIYYAQHYVVDYIAAIPIVIISLCVSFLFLRFEEWYKKKL